MKVGDLVLYIEGTTVTLDGEPIDPKQLDQMGLIINGPKQSIRRQFQDEPYMMNQWEVFWMHCNQTGWWDEHRLGAICESG